MKNKSNQGESLHYSTKRGFSLYRKLLSTKAVVVTEWILLLLFFHFLLFPEISFQLKNKSAEKVWSVCECVSVCIKECVGVCDKGTIAKPSEVIIDILYLVWSFLSLLVLQMFHCLGF